MLVVAGCLYPGASPAIQDSVKAIPVTPVTVSRRWRGAAGAAAPEWAAAA